MINIKDKHNCCGCSACVQICPKQCISFEEDWQGFRYPNVDKSVCVDCKLCEKVCPVRNQNTARVPQKVYAAINPSDNVRRLSSSGGIFSMLAEKIIDEGGVVFGARFDDNWEVIHDWSDTKEGLKKFRGSKYVQSMIGDSYIQAKCFLEKNIPVMFTGTSCQIAGLKMFLRKDYYNLLTVEVICHGVPSPLVWRKYIDEVTAHPKAVIVNNTFTSPKKIRPVITEISFRDKTNGWKKFAIDIKCKLDVAENKQSTISSKNEYTLLNESLEDNLYMRMFLKNLCLRPSCYLCPSKSGKSMCDISIADFWRIDEFDENFRDNKGTSLVMPYTEKGADYIKSIDPIIVERDYNDALRGNMCIEHSVQENEYISKFWRKFVVSGFSDLEWIYRDLSPSFLFRLKRKIKSILR